MRHSPRLTIHLTIGLCLTSCGGGGGSDGNGGGGSPDSTAPTIHLTSVRLRGTTDPSAVVVAGSRSDEDAAPTAYQFTATLGSGGEPHDPLGSGSAAVVEFTVVATTAAGSDERDIMVTIDP